MNKVEARAREMLEEVDVAIENSKKLREASTKAMAEWTAEVTERLLESETELASSIADRAEFEEAFHGWGFNATLQALGDVFAANWNTLSGISTSVIFLKKHWALGATLAAVVLNAYNGNLGKAVNATKPMLLGLRSIKTSKQREKAFEKITTEFIAEQTYAGIGSSRKVLAGIAGVSAAILLDKVRARNKRRSRTNRYRSQNYTR